MEARVFVDEGKSSVNVSNHSITQHQLSITEESKSTILELDRHTRIAEVRKPVRPALLTGVSSRKWGLYSSSRYNCSSVHFRKIGMSRVAGIPECFLADLNSRFLIEKSQLYGKHPIMGYDCRFRYGCMYVEHSYESYYDNDNKNN